MKKVIIASGPVIVEGAKVLLNKHGDDSFWKFCGGRDREDGLDLEEIAKARVKEEMGIDIKIKDPEPFMMHIRKKTDQGEIDVILVHYLAERVGEIKPMADVREWQWIPLADLRQEELGPNIIPTLIHFWFLDK